MLIFNVLVGVAIIFNTFVMSLISNVSLTAILFGYAFFTNRNNQWADFVEDKPLGDDALESGLF